jgi:hypothetical protein
MNDDIWARGVLLEVLWDKGFQHVTLAQLQTIQGQTRGEGYYGKATKPPGWEKLNNWGGVHSGFPPCQGGDLEITDNQRQVCAKAYKTPQDGAADVIRWLLPVIPKFTSDTLGNARLIQSVYHYQAPVADYALMIYVNAQKAARNIGEALVLSDPRGIKMDTAAIKGYMTEIEARWGKTKSALARAWAEYAADPTKKKPETSLEDFEQDYRGWSWFFGSNLYALWLTDSDYDEARRWDLKQQAIYAKIPGAERVDIVIPPTAAEKAAEDVAKGPPDKPLLDIGGGAAVGITAAAVAITAILVLKK